ncbi:MAG TPA: zf-HC2 domain-containing protein [Ignavibacteria bacterium]|nr:zf-HC2 domain-containing protein [Ignavibacteria bacterium]
MKNEKNINALCEEIESLIDESIDGMISLSEKEKMDSHIAGCVDCAEYLKKTEALVKKINSIPGEAVYLPYQKKLELWEKTGEKIDINKFKNDLSKSSVNADDSADDESNSESFISKFKYILSGIAAVIIIGFIVFGVKNMNISNSRFTQQNPLGIDNYWKVSNLKGDPKIGNIAMSGNDSIKEGQYILTDYNSSAELIIANLGKVIIEPNSKVLFVKGSDGNNRIQVEYGTINTDMISKDKSFFVEMPSAVANDNGGSYTITIDSTGDGIIYVKSGKVDVDSPNRDAIIPAGNVVFTKRDIGVGTPFNENASPKFRNALFNYDFGKCNDMCVTTLINNAKMSDAVTLVNLIPNVQKEYSDQVYNKLAAFVSPPSRVRGDSIPLMDEKELNEWIDKIQTEVQISVEKSMKDVEKSLENLKDIENIHPETITGLENFAKNWKFQIRTSPDGSYEWNEDSLNFDKEEFEKDMEEMKQDLKEEHKLNKIELQQEMDELKSDLQELHKDLQENMQYNYEFNGEELKKELKKANEEMRKAMKEAQKNYQQNSNSNKTKVNVYDNEEDTEIPETPEDPENDNK